MNSTGEGQPERHPNLYVEGERWVRVAPARKGVGGAYTLDGDGCARPNEARSASPTTARWTPRPLALGQTVTAFVGHAGDEDWYRVELPERAPPPGQRGTPPLPREPPRACPRSRVPRPLPRAPRRPLPPEGTAQQGTPPAPEGTFAGGEPPPPAPAGEGQPTPAEAGGHGSGPVATKRRMPGPMRGAPRASLGGAQDSIVGGRRRAAGALRAVRGGGAAVRPAEGNADEPLGLRNVGVRAKDHVVYVVVKSSWAGAGKEARRTFNANAPYTLSVSQEEAGANAELEPNEELLKATAITARGFARASCRPRRAGPLRAADERAGPREGGAERRGPAGPGALRGGAAPGRGRRRR